MTRTPSFLFSLLKPAARQTESLVKLTFGPSLNALSEPAPKRACLLAIIAACLFPAVIVGQKVSDYTQAPTAQSVASEDDLAKYDRLIDQIYASVADAHEASMQFYVNGLEESYQWKDQWRQEKEKTNRILADFRATACRIYGSDAPQPESLDSIMETVVQDMYASNQLQDLHIAYEKMLAATPDDIKLKKELAMVYLKTNRFIEAHDLLTSIDPANIGEFEESDRNLLLFLPHLIGGYQQEQQIRAKEKLADDLPRVEIVTSGGRIVIELFENEAPETVANFISLVESGHYVDTVFHRVIPNFMAQCGGFSEDLTPKIVDYTINDEFKNANFRRHFSGSLSMANTGKPNSGRAQFFINLAPTPFLDGKHTVFGTVIEGAATYQRIALTHKLSEKKTEEPIDSAVPDTILSAKVLRKRDHVYQPVKVRQ